MIFLIFYDFINIKEYANYFEYANCISGHEIKYLCLCFNLVTILVF